MKTGFVSLIGRSNVGKSTLLNALVGVKLAAVTPKPQTTRHIIHGVLNDPRGQIVFVDTPGVFLDAKGPLTRRLSERVRSALGGIDLLLYIVDPTRSVGPEERRVAAMVRESSVPKVLVVNKIDLPKATEYLQDYEELCPERRASIHVSALKGTHLKSLVTAIFERLSEGEPLYPEETKTNIDQKFWIGEIIREKVFHTMADEVPYTTTVEVEEVLDRSDLVRIDAHLVTTHPRYKRMLIGKGGRTIKEMATAARKELELALNKKVFLALDVKVDERWQERFR